MADLPKLQHYVPRFLLRHFTSGKKRQLHVLDKRDGRSFVAPVNEVGAQRGYYNVPDDITRQIVERVRQDGVEMLDAEQVVLSLEPSLGAMESRAARVVERIVRDESLGWLTAEDRVILAFVAAVQYLRVPHQREMFGQFVEGMREKVGAMLDGMGKDREAELEQAGLGPWTPEMQAQAHLQHLVDAPEYLPYFLEKDWPLQRAPTGHALYIGDNPVTLWNYGPRGDSFVRGFGLGTLKSEIALPLSPRPCLVMLCPSIVGEARVTLRGVDHLRVLRLWRGGDAARQSVGRLRVLVDAADSGRPLHLNPDNVTHLNSRQVRMASRYVYATDGYFGLARQMLADHPEMRSGPRSVTY